MSICPEGAPTSLLVQESQLHPVCVSAPWMLMGSFPTGPPRTHPRSGGKRRFLGESSHSLAPLSGFRGSWESQLKCSDLCNLVNGVGGAGSQSTMVGSHLAQPGCY